MSGVYSTFLDVLNWEVILLWPTGGLLFWVFLCTIQNKIYHFFLCDSSEATCPLASHFSTHLNRIKSPWTWRQQVLLTHKNTFIVLHGSRMQKAIIWAEPSALQILQVQQCDPVNSELQLGSIQNPRPHGINISSVKPVLLYWMCVKKTTDSRAQKIHIIFTEL